MSEGSPPAAAPAGLLIGRDRDAEYIGSFVDRATSDGRALLMEGEAGVGMNGTPRSHGRSGGGCWHRVGAEFEADVMFAALHQLLTPLLGSVSEPAPAHRSALTVALGLGEGSVSSQLLVANAALALLRHAATREPCAGNRR